MAIPPLTALERIGPKVYVRYVFPFELGEGYDLNRVADILKSGYDALTKTLPIVGCEAVPDSAPKQAGVLRAQPIADGDEIKGIAVKDLRSPGTFPMTYADLKAKHFPLSAFDGDILFRRYAWPRRGERLPISLVQANFIPGGLILTWCLFHVFGDGNTFLTWTKLWAEGCRRAQGLAILDPVHIDPAMLADRERPGVMRASGRNPGRAEDHPEYTLLPFTPQGPPRKMTSPSHRGHIFYFSPAALAALKAEASPAKATRPTDDSETTWISTNDALTALLWRTVMAVQQPHPARAPAPADDDDNPVSVLIVALDGRLRTADPPVHPHTLGCFLGWAAASAPVRDMLSSSLSLADLAVRIRQAVRRADGQFTDDVAALADRLDDVDRLVPTAFLDVPGNHCVQTTWAKFDLLVVDWGGVLGGKMQAVRAPSEGIINGLQVVLPALPDGGLEVLVGVEEGSLERLLSEPLWTRFAEAR
ncbi:trichothecene 3-o-acetyltransferase [Chaetomium strumarium]|uniref:Trichothecene 3-o-acetyltransferase n=1 Tax=Chaetomium strumarium TaxID=1170767 RepID=A0AAJ0GP61_9PEZI|nr:trichothecene 3-o-acetyltransferase [Chaetomium strumarium]